VMLRAIAEDAVSSRRAVMEKTKRVRRALEYLFMSVDSD
jgi:hypothetical protein